MTRSPNRRADSFRPPERASVRLVAAIGLAASLMLVGLVVLNSRLTDGTAPGADGAAVLGQALERGAGDVGPSGTMDGRARTEADGEHGDDEAAMDEGLEVAAVDGAAFFTYDADRSEAVAGSATAVARDDSPVRLTVSGTPIGDRALISVTVENASPDTISFPSGLVVSVSIERDGASWQVVDVGDGGVTALRSGEWARVSGEVVLTEFGSYTLSATLGYRPVETTGR